MICNAFPNAQCEVDACDSCIPRYTVGVTEVTAMCSEWNVCEWYPSILLVEFLKMRLSEIHDTLTNPINRSSKLDFYCFEPLTQIHVIDLISLLNI